MPIKRSTLSTATPIPILSSVTLTKPSPSSSSPERPRYLITIDAESDNQWSRPKTTTTRNSRFLQRFQTLCEKYGLKPTWLTSYEMARCPIFVDFARGVITRDTGEIGMHLHAWDCPPLKPLTVDDSLHHPYLTEFSEQVLREKIALLTHLLEDTFDQPMVSHRAGRWGFDEIYARALIDHGYLVDCSVTPRVSWESMPGAPDGKGGPDYRSFPAEPYYADPTDISRPGDSPLLEVPVTIVGPLGALGRRLHSLVFDRHKVLTAPVNLLFPPISWLRPNGSNLKSMLAIQRHVIDSGAPCAEFMLHSSELMPEGSPTFSTERDIELLYEHLECLFESASKTFEGATLKEFHQYYRCSTRAGLAES